MCVCTSVLMYVCMFTGKAASVLEHSNLFPPGLFVPIAAAPTAATAATNTTTTTATAGTTTTAAATNATSSVAHAQPDVSIALKRKVCGFVSF